jgi:hypothetical protein
MISSGSPWCRRRSTWTRLSNQSSMLYDSAAQSAEVLRLNRRGPGPGQPPGLRHPQGRRPRRDRLEVPHGAATVELAGGQAGRARIRHRARRAIGRLPRPGPGEAVLRTGRDAVPWVVGRAAGPGPDIAPAAVQCPDSRLRGRGVGAAADDRVGARVDPVAGEVRSAGHRGAGCMAAVDGPYPPRPRLTREERRTPGR